MKCRQNGFSSRSGTLTVALARGGVVAGTEALGRGLTDTAGEWVAEDGGSGLTDAVEVGAESNVRRDADGDPSGARSADFAISRVACGGGAGLSGTTRLGRVHHAALVTMATTEIPSIVSPRVLRRLPP
jgi:hypothetical protein